jgi:hypothetical protein
MPNAVAEEISWTIAAWVAAFFVNLAPALMPPTWTVLAAFHIGFDLALLPVTVGGAAAGALGRISMARLMARATGRLPSRRRREAAAIGTLAVKPRGWRWWAFAVAYFAGPFPSNVPFVAAGAGRLSTVRLGIAFGLARSVSDTFWVWSATRAAPRAMELLSGTFSGWQLWVAQVGGIGALALLFLLPWSRWLRVDED